MKTYEILLLENSTKVFKYLLQLNVCLAQNWVMPLAAFEMH